MTGEIVAIKLVKNTHGNEYDLVKGIREVQILKKLTKLDQNQYVTKLIDIFSSDAQ